MLFKKEFKDNFKSLLIWTGIISIIYIIIIILYPSIISSSNNINEMLEGFSPELLQIFNMDIIDLSKYSGWYTSEGLIFVILGIGIYSALLGSSIVLKEENDRTIEYLGVLPISRTKILLTKVFVGVINILLITFIVGIVNTIGASIIEEIKFSQILMISITPCLTSLILFFISLFISMFFKKTNKTLPISIGIVFIFYLIDILTKLSNKLEWLKYLTPITLADTRSLIINNEFNITYLFITIIISIFICWLSIMFYNKKEFS